MNKQRQQENLLLQILEFMRRDNYSEALYQLLSENLDKLDDDFALVVRQWVKNKLLITEELSGATLAALGEFRLIQELTTIVISQFSSFIQNFNQGNTACNLEIAIAGYESILEAISVNSRFFFKQIYQGLDFPAGYEDFVNKDENLLLSSSGLSSEEWAKNQKNLGNVYRNRVRGKKTENIERAIACYEKALQVFTQEDYLEEWAISKNNLAVAYLEIETGNKLENVNKVFNISVEVLESITQTSCPIQWADANINLAQAYMNRDSSFTEEGIEEAIKYYKKALQVFTKTDFITDWAGTQTGLARIYVARIAGEKQENLKEAIAYCEDALKIHTRKAFPFEWAKAQYVLGDSYLQLQGKLATNVKQAITCYKNALEVYKYETGRVIWAKINLNLGVAYQDYHQDNRAENIKQAIACYENAKKVFDYESFPDDWALVSNNLSSIGGCDFSDNVSQNQEKTIEEIQQNLQILNPENLPREWGIAKLNLGNVYLFRSSGDRAENLEKAIELYQEAGQVFSRKAFPSEWASIQYGLGMVFRNRILGDRKENIEQGIRYLQNALEVDTRECDPEQWARIKHNLGKAYRDRRSGNFVENIRKAIECFNNAILVRTPENFPLQWAVTQHHLGTLYFWQSAYPDQDKVELLGKAITYYESSLKILTRAAYPDDWARAQGVLAEAYTELYLKRGRTKNWENAICSAQNCLQVFRKETYPRECAESFYLQAEAYSAARRFSKTYKSCEQAIEVVESMRSEIVSGDSVKQKMAERWNRIYQMIVDVSLKLAVKKQSYQAKALEYIERSKARNLVELVANQYIQPKGNISQDCLNELKRLRWEIATERQRLDIQESIYSKDADGLSLEKNQQGLPANVIIDRTHLHKLQQQLEGLIAREIDPIDPDFSKTQKVEPISLSEIQELLPDEKTAILEWYIMGDTFITYIITRQNPDLIVWKSPFEEKGIFRDWSNEYLREYNHNNSSWNSQLSERLKKLAEILHLDELLEKQALIGCDRLILIPHQVLHLFPLHALPIKEYPSLLDRFSRGISYAPSCQLLQLIQKRQRPDFNSLFTVQNPTKDLTGADIEVEAIKNYFASASGIEKGWATKTVLEEASINTYDCIHLSCHGYFNLTYPRKSALILADAYLESAPAKFDPKNHLNFKNKVIALDKCLTLEKIFSLNLEQCRLVTLSACETGLIDSHNVSDEYIGLPSGFLYAGASNVVATLWTVNDLSTTFLMIKFYENLIQQLKKTSKLNVAIALRDAQLWLKQVDKTQLEKWLPNIPLTDPNHEAELEDWLSERQPNIKPFESPYYWAGFCAIGQ